MEESKNCERCQSEYNLLDKQRIFLPCGDTICMSCFDQTFEAESNALLCEPCGDWVQIPVKLKDNVTKLKSSNKTVWITCDEHKGVAAVYYWHKDRRLACWDCFVKNNWPTKNITTVNSEAVDQYFQRLIEIMVELRAKAENCIEQIKSYQDKSVTFTSSQFLNMTTDIYEFLSPLAQTDEDKAAIDFHQVPGKLPDEPKIELPPLDENPLKFDDYAVKTFNLKLPEQAVIIKWLDLIDKVPKFTLLFRGNRDTYKASRFHELCDNKGPTISIIKSKCGKVFGGYTATPWSSVRGYKKDEKAFLFSLSNKIKYKAKDPANNKVGHTPEYLIVFGKPNDLWLKADCDTQKNPYRIAKYIYTLQEDLAGEIVDKQEDAEFTFQVQELDVYGVEAIAQFGSTPHEEKLSNLITEAIKKQLAVKLTSGAH